MKEKEIMIDFLNEIKGLKINGKMYPKQVFTHLNEEQLKQIICSDEKLHDLYEEYKEKQIVSCKNRNELTGFIKQMINEQNDLYARKLAKVLENTPFNTVNTKELMEYTKTFNELHMNASSLCMISYIAAQIEFNEKEKQSDE